MPKNKVNSPVFVHNDSHLSLENHSLSDVVYKYSVHML